MELLWSPLRNQPQVSPAVETELVSEIAHGGITDVTVEGLKILRRHQGLLLDYLESMGLILNNLTHECGWPSHTLRIGSAVAMYAYYETGYEHNVESEAVNMGYLAAQIEGIPKAYFSSLGRDDKLAKIMEATTKSSTFDAPDSDGYKQVLDIGAGCVRFFMEQALAAA